MVVYNIIIVTESRMSLKIYMFYSMFFKQAILAANAYCGEKRMRRPVESALRLKACSTIDSASLRSPMGI